MQTCRRASRRARAAGPRASIYPDHESFTSSRSDRTMEWVTRRDIPDAVRKMRKWPHVAEWHAAGLTQAQLRSLARSGELVRVWARGICDQDTLFTEWAKASPPRDHGAARDGRTRVARPALGADSVVSHHSAALIHGLDLFPAAPGRGDLDEAAGPALQPPQVGWRCLPRGGTPGRAPDHAARGTGDHRAADCRGPCPRLVVHVRGRHGRLRATRRYGREPSRLHHQGSAHRRGPRRVRRAGPAFRWPGARSTSATRAPNRLSSHVPG